VDPRLLRLRLRRHPAPGRQVAAGPALDRGRPRGVRPVRPRHARIVVVVVGPAMAAIGPEPVGAAAVAVAVGVAVAQAAVPAAVTAPEQPVAATVVVVGGAAVVIA